MPLTDQLREQAETSMAEVSGFERSGLTEEALAALRKAVLLYAAADGATETTDEETPLKRARANACRLYAGALASAGRHAEAANIYQEATDLYGSFDGEEDRGIAKDCARRLLDNVAALRAHPTERLHLLTAHYERAQQQLALEPATESKQAECAVHIARIYQRRDRPADAVARYRETLDLYSRCEGSNEVQLACAECHHRIATLLDVRLNEPREAIRNYKLAIGLYKDHEPAVHGFQQSLELCRAALARVTARLPRQGTERDREWSHE